MRDMVTHLSEDDLILSDVYSTKENRRVFAMENIVMKVRGEIQISNSDGGKEASKKNSALKKKSAQSPLG